MRIIGVVIRGFRSTFGHLAIEVELKWKDKMYSLK
jgi:hypothetical protein